MGGCERRGRWRPAPRSVAVALMGGVELDLRDASIDPGELRITAFALMGGVEVIVPDGIDVELTGFAIMGANDHRPGDAPIRPGTPIVHVRAFSLMGATEVKVRSRGPRASCRADTRGLTLQRLEGARWPRMTIGELATRTGVAVRTLRFYSDRGLVEPAGRWTRVTRLYDEDVRRARGARAHAARPRDRAAGDPPRARARGTDWPASPRRMRPRSMPRSACCACLAPSRCSSPDTTAHPRS